MARLGNSTVSPKTHKKKRKGVHSKKRTSNHKSSKNYQKTYKGQGR